MPAPMEPARPFQEHAIPDRTIGFSTVDAGTDDYAIVMHTCISYVSMHETCMSMWACMYIYIYIIYIYIYIICMNIRVCVYEYTYHVCHIYIYIYIL